MYGDFLFLSCNFIFASYFQSIEHAKNATLINLLRTIVVLIPVALIVTFLLPSSFIWAIIMISEMITLVIILSLYHKDVFKKSALKKQPGDFECQEA